MSILGDFAQPDGNDSKAIEKGYIKEYRLCKKTGYAKSFQSISIKRVLRQ